MDEKDKEGGHTSTTLSDRKGDPYIGVVVLYNVRIEKSVTIISLNKSLELIKETMDLVVYDNSLESDRESGSIFTYGCFRIHYFHDTTNPGVSKAYNFAAKYGGELRKKWLLVLDQDTVFPIDSIEKYMMGIKENPGINLFAPVLKLASGIFVSPCRYFFKRGFPLKKVSVGINSLQGISVLNSGMLINLDAFSFVGGYNERVKLDFCDFLFVERFKKKYSFCYILDVYCEHDFSDVGRDVDALNERYGMYCRDARACGRESVLNWVQYMIVVFMRAGSLFVRTGKLGFYKTMVENFIKG